MSVPHRPPRAAGPEARLLASADALALAAVVLLVVVPFLPRLGFHSDDWGFLGGLSAHGTFRGQLEALWQPELRMRPVQILMLAGTYHLAGPAPLAFHVLTTALLLLGALCFRAVLRELGASRALAVALPLVYALLPQYSADRFWMAANIATASMAMYFLSVLADLRAVRAWRDPRRRVAWLVLAALARATGPLAYELFVPLLCLSPLLAWWQARRLAHADAADPQAEPTVPAWLARPAGLLALGALTLVTLAPVLAYKVAVSTKLHQGSLLEQVDWWRWVVTNSARISAGSWGLLLPRTLWRLARDHGTVLAAALAALAGVATAWWIATIGRDGRPARDARPLAMIAGGVALFPLGYAVFLTARQAEFATTGIANRTSIAASVGVALVWIGLARGAAAWLLPARARARAFGLLVGAMVAACTYVHAVVAEQWAAAWRQERALVATIRRALPDPPQGTMLLLGGVCPYVGPAIVFESPWDLRGALWVAFARERRYDLQADVVTPNLRVGDTTLVTSMYHGSIVRHYPYRNVVLFDATRGTVQPLPDAGAARRALAAYGADLGGGCPPGSEGQGVRLF